MQRSRSLRSLAILTIPALCVATTMVGCSRVDGYRLDPSPEARNMGETDDEIANKTTITFDTNFRNMTDDLGRLLMLDRPSRLGPKMMPH